MSATVIDIPTVTGLARAHVHEPVGARVRGTVVLGHGAGGGVESRDLVALAEALPVDGHRVVLVEQPWRVAGKRIAPAPRTLDEAWTAALTHLRDHGELLGPLLVLGGRSAGARVACRTASPLRADAVLALAFPLHPPGRPERSRADEVSGAGVPVLVIQGAKDTFGSPAEVRAALPTVPVVEVPAADHGMRVAASAPCTQAEALEVAVQGARRRLAEWSRDSSR